MSVEEATSSRSLLLFQYIVQCRYYSAKILIYLPRRAACVKTDGLSQPGRLQPGQAINHSKQILCRATPAGWRVKNYPIVATLINKFGAEGWM